MRFEWDDKKNRANRQKHGISFEEASTIFKDPRLVLVPDREVDGEYRWHAIGLYRAVAVLVVVHTQRDDGFHEVVRIISARKAESEEITVYEDENGSLHA
jgi:uncharacterized DUF497 family protein